MTSNISKNFLFQKHQCIENFITRTLIVDTKIFLGVETNFRETITNHTCQLV